MKSMSKSTQDLHRAPRAWSTASLPFIFAIPVLAAAADAPAAKQAAAASALDGFETARLIIEYNSTDRDVGVQFHVDAEQWQQVTILDPSGHAIYTATAKGRLLRSGGGSEMFVEGDEPGLDEVALEEFFNTFPEGTYRFVGRTPDGDTLSATSTFTHHIPSGPVVIMPVPSAGAKCAANTPIPATIAWNDVTTSIDGKPLRVDRYEVVIETANTDFDVHLPKDVRMVTVPAEFLKPGRSYTFEVLAIEPGGNQTITSSCFVTSQ